MAQSICLQIYFYTNKKYNKWRLIWAKLSRSGVNPGVGLNRVLGLTIDPTQIGKQLYFRLLCCPMPNLNLSGWLVGCVSGSDK